MSKSILIDTTVCTACRGCQVACKQWHDLPAEKTQNMGSFQNPQDLTFSTYKLVRMKEEIINGKLEWLFFPDQCRHCTDAPCLITADNEAAVYQDEATGAVLYTQATKKSDGDDIMGACPYNIPKKGPDGTLSKCDFCNDRVRNGLKPACVTACPTGAMTFDDRDKILDMAQKRLAMVQKKYPKATLLDPDDVNVIYLVAFDPAMYWDYAVAASRGPVGISRSVALRKMMGPLSRPLARMMWG